MDRFDRSAFPYSYYLHYCAASLLSDKSLHDFMSVHLCWSLAESCWWHCRRIYTCDCVNAVSSNGQSSCVLLVYFGLCRCVVGFLLIYQRIIFSYFDVKKWFYFDWFNQSRFNIFDYLYISVKLFERKDTALMYKV